ncbi:MAG: DUF1588 domain-containing protein [Silvanigrellales bacterium]|nr:DUF1588 domain-containing protein [Silvanigrellales bacterium]
MNFSTRVVALFTCASMAGCGIVSGEKQAHVVRRQVSDQANDLGASKALGAKSVAKDRADRLNAAMGSGRISRDIVFLHDGVTTFGLLRLTRTQITNALSDHFKIRVDLSSLPNDKPWNPSEDLRAYNQAWFDASRKIADDAFAPGGAFASECAVASESCARSFLAAKGRLLFRHPLTATELDRAMKVYSGSLAVGGRVPLARAFQSLLASPRFLYVVETPSSSSARISGAGLATRLALLINDSTPSEALLNLASSGSLDSQEGLRNQARLMLEAPEARRMARRFARKWLGLGKLAQVPKGPSVAELFTPSHVSAYAEETEKFIERYFFDGLAFDGIYGSKSSWVNRFNAPSYGLESSKPEFEWRALNPVHSGGILTQPSTLALHAVANKGSIVRRGVFLLTDVLCQPVGSPPANAEKLAAEAVGTKVVSEREKLALLRASPACASCHEKIDNLGFALEQFDAVGRAVFQNDEGLPLTAEGSIAWDAPGGKNQKFAGAAEFGAIMATSPVSRSCFVRKWADSALGAPLTPESSAQLDALASSFATHLDGKRLVLDFVVSSLFTTRPIQ